ncbi:MAG: hypothetical protein ABSF84_13305 [Acidimicrobiales bacterium]|jgi:hypothetical protein
MRGGDIVLVVGLLVATVAACLLAYDPLFGAGARFRAGVARRQYVNYQIFRRDLQKIVRETTWPEEGDLARELQAEEDAHAAREAELKSTSERLQGEHEDRTVSLATWGVGLLVLGFLLQFGGTLWNALSHAN